MKRRMLVIGIIALFLSIGLLVTSGKAESIGTDHLALNPSSSRWYVSIAGSDRNDCKEPATPCRTINGVLDKLSFLPGDAISVAAGIYSATSGNEVVFIDNFVTLSGGWDATFTSQVGQSIIDGSNERRGLMIVPGVIVSMDRFVIRNGMVKGEYGGGISNNGNLTATNCSIQNNHAKSANGINNNGWLYLENCSVKNNTEYTFLSNNEGGGIRNNGGTVVLNQSSVINNSIGGMGGGIFNFNGGTLVVNNSTISGNRAGNGGGIHNGSPTSGTTYLDNATISRNIGNGVAASGSFTIQNTILAQNYDVDGTTFKNCIGNITSAGYNIFETATDCNFISSTGDLINIYPDLMPLFGNPAYYPTRPTSPAIDAGNPDGCKDYQGNPLPVDQRGVSRYGRCDIGAYEYDPARTPIYCQLPLIYKMNCSVLYSDDFNNPYSGWPTGYDYPSSTLFSYVNDEYQIRIDTTQIGSAARPGFTATDYYVAVDLRNVDGKIGSYGLIFGISSDWTQFYTLEIYPDGWYGIYRYDPDGGAILSEAFSTAIHQGTASNQIKVKRNGASLAAYANGVELATVVDGTYTGSRYIGLVVFAYTQPFVDIRFDNFTVTPIRCGGYGPTPGLVNSAPTTWSELFDSTNGFSHGFTKHQP